MTQSIRFLHLRNIDNNGDVTLKSGKTIAYQIDDNNVMEYVVAKCGRNENYNRKIGNKIAGGRLQCNRQSCVQRYRHTVYLTSYDCPPIEVLVKLEG